MPILRAGSCKLAVVDLNLQMLAAVYERVRDPITKCLWGLYRQTGGFAGMVRTATAER